jgi:hypothetical protein
MFHDLPLFPNAPLWALLDVLIINCWSESNWIEADALNGHPLKFLLT